MTMTAGSEVKFAEGRCESDFHTIAVCAWNANIKFGTPSAVRFSTINAESKIDFSCLVGGEFCVTAFV